MDSLEPPNLRTHGPEQGTDAVRPTPLQPSHGVNTTAVLVADLI